MASECDVTSKRYHMYFNFKLGVAIAIAIGICCIHMPIDLSFNARTIHDTHGSFNISSCNCSVSFWLLNRILHWMKQLQVNTILEEY